MRKFSCEVLENRTLLSLGSVDLTYGVNGAALTPIANNGVTPVSAQAADGSIYLEFGNTQTVEHILPSGLVDPNFGTAGTAHFTGLISSTGLVLNSDGSLIVTGSVYNGGSVPAAVRFTKTGVLDTSYGTNGVAEFNVGISNYYTGPAVGLSDGSLMIFETAAPGSQLETFIIKATPSGQLDTTFHGTGYFLNPLGAASTDPAQIVIQPDGKLLVMMEEVSSGIATSVPTVERFFPDGTSDPSFGVDGAIRLDNPNLSDFNSMAVRPDGRIVLAGLYQDNPAVYQYLTDGTLDPTFGTGGISQAMGNLPASTIALRPDGSLRIAGSVFVKTRYEAYIAALTPTGQLQIGYGQLGESKLPYASSGDERAGTLLMRPDGSEILTSSISAGGFVLRHIIDQPVGSGVGSMTVSGQLYNDINADGVYDSGDTTTGLANVGLWLDLNDDGVYESGEPVTTTASDGSYSFQNVPAGLHAVVLANGVTSATVVQTEPVGGQGRAFQAVAGDVLTQQNFGLTTSISSLASVSSTAFKATIYGYGFEEGSTTPLPGLSFVLDLNQNGKADPGEPVVISDASGKFHFNNLPAGYYTMLSTTTGWGGWLEFGSIPPADYFSLSAGETDNESPYLSQLGVITVSVLQDTTGYGYGDTPVDATVYLDLNNNGVLDAGEPSLTTSGYTTGFSNVAPGVYHVRQIVPAGLQQLLPVDEAQQTVTVSAGGVAGVGFVDIATPANATITGTVFNDSNFNGVKDPGEVCLGQKTVYLDLNDNGKFDAGEPVTVTDAFDGHYRFTNLASGTYVVREIEPAGWIHASNFSGLTVTVAPGQMSINNDLGTTEAAQISGIVFGDSNQDGMQDSGETGIAGRTVYIDQNGNGVLDNGEPVATTDSTGAFYFQDLTPGSYSIREVVPSGSAQTFPASNAAQNITLAVGQLAKTQFGVSYNLSPVALPGGPYTVNEGSTVTFDGSASYETGGTIVSYQWDFNYDGQTFTADGTGASVSFSAATLDGPSTRSVALRVIDASGASTIASTTIQINNVPPTATFTGSTIVLGNAGAVSFTNAFDPSTADTAAGFVYSYDFNDDGVWDLVTTAASATVPASYLLSVGSHTIAGEITDKDGGSTSYTTTVQVNASSQLTGTTIGTQGSYLNDGNTSAKAFDGDLTTYFDGPTNSNDWIGLDLGTPKIITSLAYASRSGWASRMNGGIFQASNSSSFSGGVVNLYTIGSNANPPSNALTTQTINDNNAYRYVRYLAPPKSFGNVAEIQFFGKAPLTLTKFTGTEIGTSGSYQNKGNTIAKALDGNLSTFFDGPTANGNWLGLDLGSARIVKQISFAPRSGYASRMVGGIFQASNSANFSTGVVNLYTVTSSPTQNVLTNVTVNVAAGYRYYRYLSPNGSEGNIAEVQFFG